MVFSLVSFYAEVYCLIGKVVFLSEDSELNANSALCALLPVSSISFFFFFSFFLIFVLFFYP